VTTRNVFLSYSRLDRGVVTPIAALLRGTDANVFRDEESIIPGQKWEDAIYDAIRSCDTILVFWSAAANDSKSVEKEYSLAITLKRRIVPILLDDAPLIEVLAQYQWVDLRVVVRSATVRSIGTALVAPSLALGWIPSIGTLLTFPIASRIAAIMGGTIILNIQLTEAEQIAAREALLSRISRH
jgi:hypothetical protein